MMMTSFTVRSSDKRATACWVGGGEGKGKREGGRESWGREGNHLPDCTLHASLVFPRHATSLAAAANMVNITEINEENASTNPFEETRTGAQRRDRGAGGRDSPPSTSTPRATPFRPYQLPRRGGATAGPSDQGEALMCDYRVAIDQVDGRLTVSGPRIPHKLKVRMKRRIWPVKLSVGLDYDVANRIVTPVAKVKDAMFGGRVRADLGRSELNYRKDIEVSSGWRLQVGASVQWCDDLGNLGLKRPHFSFSFEPTARVSKYGGNFSVTGPNTASSSSEDISPSFDVRAKMPLLSSNLKGELCTNARIPLPSAKFEHNADSTSAEVEVFGRGGFHVHVAQANAILYL